MEKLSKFDNKLQKLYKIDFKWKKSPNLIKIILKR